MIDKLPIRWTDPGSWPWVVYVWIAFALVGPIIQVWNWLRRKRTATWPISDGRIESVEVAKPVFRFGRRSGYYAAKINYSYSIHGTACSGRFTRDLPTQEEANELVRDLNGKAVAVHVSPSNKERSALLESDISVLLQNRRPAIRQVLPNRIPFSALPYLRIFAFLSCIGLALSLWVHIGALTGRRVAPTVLFAGLHLGIFVVFIPAVLAAKRMVGNVNRRDFWKVVLAGAPDWLRYVVYGFLGYACINFLLFMTQMQSGGKDNGFSAADWRGFSGHWMAFYSASFAILYSAIRNAQPGLSCPNGHLVPRGQEFCSRCGQPIGRSM